MRRYTMLVFVLMLVLVTDSLFGQATSFHMLRKGHSYFYASTNGGFETLSNIPINSLRCLKCHPGKYANGSAVDTATYQPGCNDCHNFSIGNAVADSTCKKCHSRQKVEIANYTDKHRSAGMSCVTCHIKDEMHADATPYSTPFDTVQGKTCQTVGCHNVIPVTPNNTYAHSTHNSKVECAACHTRSQITCYNCHFETEIWSGMKQFKRPIAQFKGFIMLARLTKTGKVGVVNYQSIIYQGNKTFNAWGPYYPHTIMPKDSTRACTECHNNANMTEYNTTQHIYVAKWDSTSTPKKIVHKTGVIPIPPDYQTSLLFDFANYIGRVDTMYTNPAMWAYAKTGLNSQQMLSKYVMPLTAAQMTKLGSTIGITPIGNVIPRNFDISQNYPNPFNPTTKIRFSIPKSSNVSIKVYNSLGQEVSAIIVNEFLQAGSYEVNFIGSELNSGVYFYKFTAQDFSKTMKMMLLK